MIALYDAQALAAHSSLHGVDPQHGERLARLVLRYGVPFEEALGKLHGPVPTDWATGLRTDGLAVLNRTDSAADGATKWVLGTSTGECIESVLLRIASGRCSLCLSIQTSCPIACRFCSSGAVGKKPSPLALADVLGQVLHARQVLRGEGKQLRNLVFMGMGEPLLEEGLLHAALDRLTCERAFAFSPTRLMVSTVGLPAAMLRLADAFPDVRQALSLHSARQEVRQVLIPQARSHNVEELRETVREIGSRTGSQVLIEYLLLQGVNDTPQDERSLAVWLEGLPVKLNLIPYNVPANSLPGSSVDMTLRPSPIAAREAFAKRMRATGVATTLRHSLGSDIGAGCGQLAGGGR